MASRPEAAGVPRASAVARVDGQLDGGGVVGDAITLGAVGLDVSEDLPALAVGNGRADAVVLDVFVPVRTPCMGRSEGEREKREQGEHDDGWQNSSQGLGRECWR